MDNNPLPQKYTLNYIKMASYILGLIGLYGVLKLGLLVSLFSGLVIYTIVQYFVGHRYVLCSMVLSHCSAALRKSFNSLITLSISF